MQKLANNAYAALTANITNVATTITVDAATADNFPIADTGTDPVNTTGKDWFKAVLEDASGNLEIIYVRTRTAGSGIFGNVQRGQDGTTALAFLAGSICEIRPLASDFESGANAAALSLPRAGGTLEGPLILDGDAVDPLNPTTLQQMEAALDAAADVSQDALDAAVLAITTAIAAAVKLAAPPGKVSHFMQITAPSGWVKAGSGTIGDATSGGTSRANADAADLFAVIWNQFSNAIAPIQDSAGVASTRGANAAADFAAHKRLPLHDGRGYFTRNLDDGAGVDAGRGLGTLQADDNKAHTHQQANQTLTRGATALASGVDLGISDGPSTTQSSGGSESRPKSIAWLCCFKL